MTVGSVLAPPPTPSQGRSSVRPWPRRWAEQAPLLERQHDRLEALLADLAALHRQPLGADPAAAALAQELCCRRLLWQLRLHLRLEERWLAAWGCLCPGHGAAHREALQAALMGYCRAGNDRSARLDWLLGLQAWFERHRSGPDARAYAQASATDDRPAVTSA